MAVSLCKVGWRVGSQRLHMSITVATMSPRVEAHECLVLPSSDVCTCADAGEGIRGGRSTRGAVAELQPGRVSGAGQQRRRRRVVPALHGPQGRPHREPGGALFVPQWAVGTIQAIVRVAGPFLQESTKGVPRVSVVHINSRSPSSLTTSPSADSKNLAGFLPVFPRHSVTRGHSDAQV